MAMPKHLMNVQKFGPKRLQGHGRVHRYVKGKLVADPLPDRVPDARDRQKLQDKIADVLSRPMPVEGEVFNFETFSPMPDRVLLRVGAEVAQVGAIHIPENHRSRGNGMVVVLAGQYFREEFKPGDFVILDKNAHQRPVSFRGREDHYVVVMGRYIAALLD